MTRKPIRVAHPILRLLLVLCIIGVIGNGLTHIAVFYDLSFSSAVMALIGIFINAFTD